MIFGILNIVVFFNQLGDFFFFFLHVASVYVLIMLRKKKAP